MEPSKDPIAVRITRLNRQITGKVTSGLSKLNKRTIDREALLDALTVLYDECNDDPVKKCDDLVKVFVDKYRSTLAELRRARVCITDFDMVQTIGRGHFGEVHMVREKQTGDVYALKTLRKEQARKRAVAAAEDERDVLATATSHWIPKLQYAFQDCNNLYLIMELCSGGDLAGLLSRRNNPLSERDAAFYIAEVAHALKAIHGMGYVHRDVKPHNIFLDRCGHVKLGDFGSCARLSEGGSWGVAVGTADYVAPELLAAADCAARHSVCLEYCGRVVTNAVSACDYWSLGVVAYELVTLRRPFSTGDEDSMAQILGNIQKYEGEPNAEVLFVGEGPSRDWRNLVAGLLRVTPGRRYSYLDVLQHSALQHLPAHSIRDQAPPWVPCIRGAEDACYFSPPPRASASPNAAPFRTRPPFAGQLPFVGYSYVAPDEHEENSGGFNASHDCTAIDLATFKSAEKLAAMRGREIASLQNKLAEAEAATSASVERTRLEAETEAERLRARLQAEITALALQNKRLERQVEVEKEERMALQRTNQELSVGIAERNSAEIRSAKMAAMELQTERDMLKDDLRRLESRVEQLQDECKRAAVEAETARSQQQHYKDTIAKERAMRRQTLSGGEAESREAATRIANAEANAARELRAKDKAEKRVAALEAENAAIRDELDDVKQEFNSVKEILSDKQRRSAASASELKTAQVQLAQERMRCSTLLTQVQELERGMEEAVRRESALEEQYARTEARLNERLEAAEARATAVLHEDARHREKVNTLEQLVRQLEREVSALEKRACIECSARAQNRAGSDQEAQGPSSPIKEHRASNESRDRKDCQSDTESMADVAHAQVSLLKEQLERAESQLQARAEEIAALRQETRAANLAKWRKEREYNELSVDSKATARELKRLEERISTALEARKNAEQKANSLQSEMATLKPQYEQATKDLASLKEQLERLQKVHETAQAEVDRSRNDIRKLKSELQYSEKRRMHAEEQEELSSRERAQLRDELHATRQHNTELVQNNKALQEACSMLEEQLTDLEKLADLHEFKSKDLKNELDRVRGELETCHERLATAEQLASERGAAVTRLTVQQDEMRDGMRLAQCELAKLRERLEGRECRVAELEARTATLESESASHSAALNSAARRVRELQEECAALRTRAHQHHSHALQLQASHADLQEELSAAREAAEAASAWWRTRETKADATLRQQAKLIDFLQAKVEEAGRKKCSFGNKLFGRSGRRSAVSPPLRRANRELRDEVDRLRSKLAACNTNGDAGYPPTPKRDKPKVVNGIRKSTEGPDGDQDKTLQIVWPDGDRERMRVKCFDDVLVLSGVGCELRAKLLNVDAKNLPQNEANRAFTVRLEHSPRGSEAAIVCSSLAERAQWVSRLTAAARTTAPGYRPAVLVDCCQIPAAALHIGDNAVAIGTNSGLHSLRGEIQVEWETESPARRGEGGASCLAMAAGRALLVWQGALAHCGALALGSALLRAARLRPALCVRRVPLPDLTAPHVLKAIIGDNGDGITAVVGCGRRVFLLRYDAANSDFKIARSLTVDRPPSSLLLTTKTLYIAGEKPLKVNLPAGTLESFALDEPIVAAAAKKHSPPKAILLIRDKPVEILLCYTECGVFLDEYGKRTRNEDPTWSSAIKYWEFVNPFLYLIGDDKITILYLTEETYKAPPCTCDTTSLASSTSGSYSPKIFMMKLNDPALLGTTPNGIIVRSKVDDGYNVSVVEGMQAFRSIGASVESLATISDLKGSSTDLCGSVSDLSPQNMSQESVEVTTGFLADIRKRAQQLRKKNRKEQSPDDVIKEILTTEVNLKRVSSGRKSPASISEFDSDSEEDESDEKSESAKNTADLCAEMFTRQVRFN